jgi:hypothetical protein
VMVLNPKHNQDVGAYGGRGAAPIWHDAFLPILSQQPAVSFPPAGLPLQDPNPPPPPRPRPQPQSPAPEEPQVNVPVEEVPVEPADPFSDPNFPFND